MFWLLSSKQIYHNYESCFCRACSNKHTATAAAPFTTCERDDSNITTKQINKTLATSKGTITVHSVITNVPQSSEHPQEYSYKCQKATLMEISVEGAAKDSPDKNPETIELWDISLTTTDDTGGITAKDIDDDSEFAAYAENNKLHSFDSSALDQSDSERGWIAFSMPASETGNAKSLLYNKYGEDKALDL